MLDIEVATCTFADVAQKIATECARKEERRLQIIGRWHSMLGWIRVAILEDQAGMDEERVIADMVYCLTDIAAGAVAILQQLGVEEPAASFIAEYERATIKHPNMTLDCDGPTDELRFYALAEEMGEVCAALTYDNKASTGHNSDLISEVTQVGGLAIAWLLRYRAEES